MQLIHGSAISGSIFSGKVRTFIQNRYPAFSKSIENSAVESELSRLQSGMKRLGDSIQAALEEPDLTQLDKDILNTHLMILTDIEINRILDEAVSGKFMSAPQAVLSTYEKVIRNFEQMENRYFAQRADDYKDVAHRLMLTLLGSKDKSGSAYAPDDIVFIHEITPSLVTTFAKAGLKAYCTERGSYNSHSSILTRAMGITALVARESLLGSVKDGENAILDAESGVIIINPDADQTALYSGKQTSLEKRQAALLSELDLPAVTQNGINIKIKANIEYPGELPNVLENRCEGIGLFRTEFIYLNRTTVPDEEEQFCTYSDLLKGLNGLPAIIRTFDLGGDKLSFLQKYSREENPYLGSRGIRFSLQEQALFKTQLRAILRASVHGKAAIMFPMIICTEDFKAGLKIVRECMQELDIAGLKYDSDIPVGAMIETPSAALCAGQLAQVCDFFSLGTNDLVQYTLAVDRNNDLVAPYYVQHHPSVLQLINLTIIAAQKAGIPLSICGEMASKPMYVPLLIGMGITDISINPNQAAEVKAIIRNCDASLFDTIRSFDFETDIAHIEHLLSDTLKPYQIIQS